MIALVTWRIFTSIYDLYLICIFPTYLYLYHLQMRRLYFEDFIDNDKYSGRLYSLAGGGMSGSTAQMESRKHGVTMMAPPSEQTDNSICAQ